ncbi:MAG: protein kinase [Sedimentisphaerales bacterium]|nr:protein kinase [Sedimentisphaerales bacterium]
MDHHSKTNQPAIIAKADTKLKRGRRLGKYRLEKHLGTGGFCEVWKARDQIENIWTALKIPLVNTSGIRDNQALLREIRLVAKLRHPHILHVKNADIIQGHAVLATQLSVGTLDDRSKPLAPHRILSIIIQVLDALAYAHKNKVIHCDVTPSNIFLFPENKAALGDFGIGLQFKSRMNTVDDFGTPGYVAPEQAYGRPAYCSDCFSVALVLYEYLTGYLPRWPFAWPFPGYEKLRLRTGREFTNFIKHALAVDPKKRFANAAAMLEALHAAIPKNLKIKLALPLKSKKELHWRSIRRQAFIKRYQKIFPHFHRCSHCKEPIAESMSCCPFCGTQNRFDHRSQFDHLCPYCHKGVLPEWHYCPWCYSPGFDSPAPRKTRNIKYHANCKHCGGRIMRFMNYCPWCHRKIRHPWQAHPFPEFCTRCHWSVDSDFWLFCPWCQHQLI